MQENAYMRKALAPGFGAILEAKPGDDLPGVEQARAILSLLDDAGAILFRGFPLTPTAFATFGRVLMGRRLVYGGVRETVSEDDEVQLVEPGSLAFGLHCELAATPFRPDLCLFGCEVPPERGGQTIVADGVAFLAGLGADTRRLFETRRIKYGWRYRAAHYRRMFGITDGVSLRTRDIRLPGFSYEIEPDDSVSTRYVTDAVVTRGARHPAFANSLCTVGALRPDRPFYSVFEDDTPIANDLRAEIRSVGESVTTAIEWQAGDVLVIDNWRVLHGRRAFDDPKRRIYAAFGGREAT